MMYFLVAAGAAKSKGFSSKRRGKEGFASRLGKWRQSAVGGSPPHVAGKMKSRARLSPWNSLVSFDAVSPSGPSLLCLEHL